MSGPQNLLIYAAFFCALYSNCFSYMMIKETKIGFLPILKKMFNASILFKTTTRVIILNILTTWKKPIHLFFKGGTYFTYRYVLPILGWSATYIKIKAFYIYF